MKQLPWLAAIVGVFALAIAGAMYFGNGEPRVVSSHEFAFVTSAQCPGDASRYYVCSAIYVTNADAISGSHHPLTALPPGTRVIFLRDGWMIGVTWSPDGRQLAYLTQNAGQDESGKFKIFGYDLWKVHADGSHNERLDTDVLEPFREGSGGYALPRLTWTDSGIVADLRPVDFKRGRIDGTFVDGESTTADRALTAFHGTGIDSSWICVSDAAFDRASSRCFGDGSFGTPVWKPY